MKNVRVKVRHQTCDNWFDVGIFENRKMIMTTWPKDWKTKRGATNVAKAMSKKIGIKYDPEIIEMHGC